MVHVPPIATMETAMVAMGQVCLRLSRIALPGFCLLMFLTTIGWLLVMRNHCNHHIQSVRNGISTGEG
jgi:hypothetical protein